MSATNTTTNLGLSQFINTDVPAWRGDYNGDMLKIDNAYIADISSATAETSADPSDYMKFYDVSASTNKKILVSDLLKGAKVEDLTDTDITSVANEDGLVYNSTSQKWENKQIVQKNQISNPNLLDNPWFTVNQREAVTYNTPWGMSVDRWRTDQNITLTVTSSGVQIANDHATDWRNLYMQVSEEDYKNLIGRPITMSVMLSDGTIKSGTITAPAMAISQNETYPIVDGGTFAAGMFTIYNQSPIAVQYYVGIPAGGTLNIRAVKIELGTVSTLGLDTAPNFEQELAKCQRYFLRVAGNVVALNDQGTYDDSFFHEMRANVAFSNGSVSVWGGGGWTPVTPSDFNADNNGGKNFVRLVIKLGTTYAYSNVLVNYDISADL